MNFSTAGSVWDGIIYAPIVSTGSVLDLGDMGVLVNLPQNNSTTTYTHAVLLTYMAGGSGGTSLIASGGLFTLSMKINSSTVSSGQTISIFRSYYKYDCNY